MSHLSDTGYTYFQHLRRAWRLSFILFVHGLFPEIWKTKASDEICNKANLDDETHTYLLKKLSGAEKHLGTKE